MIELNFEPRCPKYSARKHNDPYFPPVYMDANKNNVLNMILWGLPITDFHYLFHLEDYNVFLILLPLSFCILFFKTFHL